MGTFSIYHWVIVLVVLLLVFGPKRLASVGQGLGEGIKALRDGLKDDGGSNAGSANASAEKRQLDETK